MKEQTPNNAANEAPPELDAATASREAVREKMADAQTPGFQAEFDPDEAGHAGAFAEDALSELDAVASSGDIVLVDDSMEPAFLDEDGKTYAVPPFITTTNARELFGLRPDETVAQAAARKALEGHNTPTKEVEPTSPFDAAGEL